jgi:hypothetical protein
MKSVTGGFDLLLFCPSKATSIHSKYSTLERVDKHEHHMPPLAQTGLTVVEDRTKRPPDAYFYPFFYYTQL